MASALPSERPLSLSLPSTLHRSLSLRIGAGTGLFTRALLAHPEWSSSIGQLIAVEPSQGMRETFSKLVRDDRVTVHQGTFDTTDIQDGWADFVIIAQVNLIYPSPSTLIRVTCLCAPIRPSIGALTMSPPSKNLLGS
jgi:hypothetical protein